MTHETTYADQSSIVTVNRKGRTSQILNEANNMFVEFSRDCIWPVLDIGCAMGVATIAALEAGATVIANDIDELHLSEVYKNTPESLQDRLTLNSDRFPNQTNFGKCSLGAVHASNLLNFLMGDELERGLKKIFKWLVPGGRVFTISGTPYAKNICGFIDKFEDNKRKGARWPGECYSLSSFSNDKTISELPEELHLLDDETLIRASTEIGYNVIEAKMFQRRYTPSYIKLDGRENILLTLEKPREKE